jgi:hypothetical protein
MVLYTSLRTKRLHIQPLKLSHTFNFCETVKSWDFTNFESTCGNYPNDGPPLTRWVCSQIWLARSRAGNITVLPHNRDSLQVDSIPSRHHTERIGPLNPAANWQQCHFTEIIHYGCDNSVFVTYLGRYCNLERNSSWKKNKIAHTSLGSFQ